MEKNTAKQLHRFAYDLSLIHIFFAQRSVPEQVNTLFCVFSVAREGRLCVGCDEDVYKRQGIDRESLKQARDLVTSRMQELLEAGF